MISIFEKSKLLVAEEKMKKIYIWGTGLESEKCILNICRKKCHIAGYIETYPQKKIWKDMAVYSSSILPELEYDYIIIANIYYDEIIYDIKAKKLADENKIINWIKLRECIYNYPKEIWSVFSDDFLQSNFYFFDFGKTVFSQYLLKKLDNYKKIYIYDLRLINNDLDIGIFFNELLTNLKDHEIGMAFIPNENYLDQNWYHNLLYVLDKNAFVIWKDEESAYAEYIKINPEKFSFIKFSILQFTRKEKRIVHKGKYLLFDPKPEYEKKRYLINQAKYIKIYNLRCDRIGEEIRILNKLLLDETENEIFKMYIPIDGYSRPFDGSNACFNELVGRQINLLKNQEEYFFWIQDIFEKYEKYEYDREWISVRNCACKIVETDLLIDFNINELKFGRELIKNKIGLMGEYVCLHTRDREYLKNILPDEDCSYHDYRDVTFDVMKNAIEYFDKNGIQSVRMGQIAEQKEISRKCINFVGLGYDEFLDLTIHRFCKFYLGSGAGVSLLPQVFAKPVALLLPYYPAIEHNIFCHKEDLCIFNRLYSAIEKRELSFDEMFNIAIDFTCIGKLDGEYFAKNGLELIPFSQEDILGMAIEMNEKLDGKWKEKNEDIELQNVFNLKLHECIKNNNIHISEILPVNVATSYLRKYKYLLED